MGRNIVLKTMVNENGDNAEDRPDGTRKGEEVEKGNADDSGSESEQQGEE